MDFPASRLVGLLSLCALAAACRAEPPRPPNILVVIADDQSVSTLGPDAPAWLRTPALDALADGGVVFRRAFVTTSLCSPSRASMLTGQYARRHGIWDNREGLPQGTPTYPALLGAAGYDTGYFGKWHLGRDEGARPGFSESISYAGQGRYFGAEFLNGRSGERVTPDGWVDDVTTDFAIEFIGRPRTRPFLAVVGFKGPHRPRKPPARRADMYEDVPLPVPPNSRSFPPFPMFHEFVALAKAHGVPLERFSPAENWREEWEGPRESQLAHEPRMGDDDYLRDYYRVITALDDDVGRLLAKLDEMGITRDTLVVYVSDNGIANGEHGLAGKRTAYEESMRVPLLLRYPARVEAGARDAIALNVDLAPTLLDYAGVQVPDSMQGRSLRPVIEGRSRGWRNDLFYEFRMGSLQYMASWVPTLRAVRTAREKLVVYEGYPGWTELYDLDADPFEMNDLSRDPASRSRRDRLEARLVELAAEAQ